MVPEILHRCPACGVAIREFGEGVLFCPECGKPLAAKEAKTTASSRAAKTTADEAVESVPAPAETHPEADKSDPRSAANIPASGADGPMHMARERTRETLHRASNVARGAIEDNVKRVEKIHHVSS